MARRFEHRHERRCRRRCAVKGHKTRECRRSGQGECRRSAPRLRQRHQEPGLAVPDQPGRPVAGGGDDRQTSRPGLDHDVAERLLQRWADQEIGVGPSAPARRRASPERRRALRCRDRVPCHRAARAATGDPQFDPARRRRRFKQQLETLVAMEPPDRRAGGLSAGAAAAGKARRPVHPAQHDRLTPAGNLAAKGDAARQIEDAAEAGLCDRNAAIAQTPARQGSRRISTRWFSPARCKASASLTKKVSAPPCRAPAIVC